MNIAVIVTTYNRPSVLAALSRSERPLPNEGRIDVFEITPVGPSVTVIPIR